MHVNNGTNLYCVAAVFADHGGSRGVNGFIGTAGSLHYKHVCTCLRLRGRASRRGFRTDRVQPLHRAYDRAPQKQRETACQHGGMYLQRKRTRSLWRRKGEQLQAAVEKNATYLGRSGTSTLQQLAAGVGAIVVRRAGECNRGGSHPCQALSPRHSVLGSICRFLCPPEVSPASALRPVWGLLTVRRCPLTEEPSSEMVAKSRLSRFEVLIRSGAITLSLSFLCIPHEALAAAQVAAEGRITPTGLRDRCFHGTQQRGRWEYREREREERKETELGRELGVEKGVLLASKSCGTGALRAVELSIGAVRPRARSTAAVVWCSGTQYTREKQVAHALVFLFRVVGTTRSLSRVR